MGLGRSARKEDDATDVADEAPQIKVSRSGVARVDIEGLLRSKAFKRQVGEARTWVSKHLKTNKR